METLDSVKIKIENVRSKLMDLMENTEDYNSEEVLEVSECLDLLINKYLQCK